MNGIGYQANAAGHPNDPFSNNAFGRLERTCRQFNDIVRRTRGNNLPEDRELRTLRQTIVQHQEEFRAILGNNPRRLANLERRFPDALAALEQPNEPDTGICCDPLEFGYSLLVTVVGITIVASPFFVAALGSEPR